MDKFWKVQAKTDKTGELMIYGEIASAQVWGDEVIPKQIDSDIKALGEIDTLNVYVNSGGGAVFAGMAIYNIIKRAKAATKNAYIDGLAGSIASIIPMACDKVYMPANAMMMIHNPWGIAAGNAAEFRKMAESLDKMRESMLTVYRDKTGMKDDDIIALLDDETWMTADEAVKLKFADELQEEVKIAASIDGGYLIYGDVKTEISRFKNFKADKITEYREAAPEPVAVNKDAEETNALTAELQSQSREFERITNKITGGVK